MRDISGLLIVEIVEHRFDDDLRVSRARLRGCGACHREQHAPIVNSLGKAGTATPTNIVSMASFMRPSENLLKDELSIIDCEVRSESSVELRDH